MDEKRVAIVIGHTKSLPGAFAAPPLSQHEYGYNQEVALICFTHGRNLGLDCRIFDRSGKTIEEVYKEVNQFGGVAIELHFNAADGKAFGTETLYDLDPLDCKRLAHFVQRNTCRVFDRYRNGGDRGLKLIDNDAQRGHRNLSFCKIPSCLVEPAFGDNSEEARLLRDMKSDYAKSLMEAVKEYYEVQ